MLPIHTVFLILAVLFGLIGGLRGWAKEIIVVCSVIVALFFQHVLLILDPLRSLFYNLAPTTQFYVSRRQPIDYGTYVRFRKKLHTH